MTRQPKKWIAVLLGLFLSPLALLYVARWTWAAVYLLVALALGVFSMFGRFADWAAVLQLAFVIICAVHAYRLAARWPEGRERPLYSRWPGLLGSVVALAALLFFVRAFGWEPFAIPSGSMLPNLPVHSRVVVQKWGYGNYGSYGLQLWRTPVSAPVARGDILVFDSIADRTVRFVNRVIGMPGDRIEYRGKQLSINGRPVPLRADGTYFDADRLALVPLFVESTDGVDYPVLADRDRPPLPVFADDFPLKDQCTYAVDGLVCTVPAGHYFMMGDNRDNSRDSRYWGFLPADHIVGKVVQVLR